MTGAADIEMLPLPEWLSERDEKTKLVARNYARAVAEHNVKERDAEIEALRAEVEHMTAGMNAALTKVIEFRNARHEAESRAERLAEALRGLLALPIAEEELRYLDKGIGTATRNAAWLRARAALRDALTNDHGLALELLLTHLLTALLDPGSTSQRVFAIRLDNPHRTDTHGKSVELADVVSSPASQAVDAKLKALKSKLPKKAADIQAWVATKSVDELHELLALVAAATLDPTKDQARALAQLTKLDMREFWKPDAEHYLNHVPKPLAAEAVAEVHGKAAGEKVAAMKKNEAIAEAAKLLAGSGWLPKPLRGPGYKLAKPGTAAKAAQNKAKAPAKKKPAAKKAPAKQPAKKPKKSKTKA